MLQGGAHLPGVQRVDPSVGLEDGEQRRRIGHALPHVVVGRVGVQPGELVGLLGGAVLDVPRRAQAEQLVADHVEQRRRADHRGVQLGALGQGRADQQAAVGAAGDGQLRGRGHAGGDEVLGRRVQVVEDVLLVGEHPGPVPLLALLAAAAQLGDGVRAARLDPAQDGRGVTGGHRDAEAAVAVQDGGARALGAGKGDHQHVDLAAVGRAVGHLLGVDGGYLDGAGGGGPERRLAGAGVVALDARRRGVVGVAEPGLVAALGTLADAADGAQPGSRHLADALAGDQVVHRDLADRVAGPADEHDRPVEAVEDREVRQHGLVVLRDQVAPVLEPRVGRVGHADAGTRGLPVGEDVQAAVAAEVQGALGVDALLDDDQFGRGVGGRLEVRHPQVVARRRTPGGGDLQPAAVEGDRHTVVVGLLQALAEDQDVLLGGGADPVQVDPAVVLLLTLGHLGGGQPAHVVKGLAAGQPRHGGVAAAVDRPLDPVAVRDVHQVEARLLVTAHRDLVGEQAALLVGLPGVEGGQPGRVQRHRVEQRPLGAAWVHGVEHGVLLPGGAPHEEPPLPPPRRRADRPRAEQLRDPGLEALTSGKGVQPGLQQSLLPHQPVLRRRVVRVLKPSVGVGNRHTVELLDELETAGWRVWLSRHGWNPTTSGPRDGLIAREAYLICGGRS